MKTQFENLHESRQIVRALLFSCSRVMELAGLRWRDVDLRRGLVTLYQEKNATGEDPTDCGTVAGRSGISAAWFAGSICIR